MFPDEFADSKNNLRLLRRQLVWQHARFAVARRYRRCRPKQRYGGLSIQIAYTPAMRNSYPFR